MYVRRNYREPFFRERRPSGHWRWWLFAIGLVAGLGFFLNSQPQVVQSALDRLSGVEVTPTPFASDLAQDAVRLYRDGDLSGAIALFARAIEQRPENVNYLFEYGMLLIDDGRAPEAQAIAEQIASLSPGDVRALSLRARALVWQSDYRGAIPVGQIAIEVAPDFAPAYEALARAYTGSGQWREGLRYGELAVDMAPGDVRAHWAYANALTAVGAFDEAVVELRNAIELHPAFLPPYFELAFIYLSQDRDQEAIDIYDRILGIQPRNARALLRQCEAYRKVGEFRRALGRCQDAVDADPNFLAAQFRLGVLQYAEREFEEARRAFEACLRIDNTSMVCTYRLGLTQYYLGDCDRAWRLLQDGLIMAQAQGGADADIAIIREGLTAITTDANCAAYRGRLPGGPPPVDDAPADAANDA